MAGINAGKRRGTGPGARGRGYKQQCGEWRRPPDGCSPWLGKGGRGHRSRAVAVLPPEVSGQLAGATAAGGRRHRQRCAARGGRTALRSCSTAPHAAGGQQRRSPGAGALLVWGKWQGRRPRATA